MGLLSVLSTQNKMKCFVVLSAVVACGFAAPAADADAQLLAGHGLLGHGLVGGVYAAGHAVAAPAVAATYAAPAVATYAHAAPAVATYAHASPVVVATAPVVQHVGYNVHHQVHHVPQVSVQKHVSTHTTS